jgi:hypothetical protein
MLATYKEVNITLQGSTVSISSFAHVDAILIQPCLSKSHGEKKIKLKKPKYLSSNKVRLPGSRTSRVPFVSTFLFLNEAPGTRTSAQDQKNQLAKGLDPIMTVCALYPSNLPNP